METAPAGSLTHGDGRRHRRPAAGVAPTPGARSAPRVTASLRTAARLPAAHQKGRTTMSKTRKLLLVGVLVACACGVVALKAARATPPRGVTNTLLAGPVAFDDIDAVVHTRDFKARIKTQGP